VLEHAPAGQTQGLTATRSHRKQLPVTGAIQMLAGKYRLDTRLSEYGTKI
jgi:hypothetical protein